MGLNCLKEKPVIKLAHLIMTGTGSHDTVLEHLVIQDIPDPCLRQILNEVSHSLSQCEDK